MVLRDYRDLTVFLWVLGAFDKQKRVLDEGIVSAVEKPAAEPAPPDPKR